MGSQARQSLSRLSSGSRLRPGRLILVIFGIGALLLARGEGWAQTPPPPPPDTLLIVEDVIPADTIPGDTVPVDTLKPVVVIAPFQPGGEASWAAGIWEWDREALLRSSGLTLTELLAEIPGVVSVRSGFLGHSEAAALPGGAGGYIELYLDGYALDPLDGSTYDLSRLELVELNRVRVERRGGGFRVDLETIAPHDNRPFSMVEAGTGEYGARMVRGTFMTPDFLIGPLAAGIERLEGGGIGNTEPANTFAGWLKWARGFGPTTLQFEFRSNTIEWETPERVGLEGYRQDWVARARTRVSPELTTDAFIGRSRIEDQYPDTTIERGGLQGGLRALYRRDALWLAGTLRGRDQRLLPRIDADLAGGVALPGGVDLSGDLRHSGWRGGRSGNSWSARAEFEPLTGIRTFAELSSGVRGIKGLWNEIDQVDDDADPDGEIEEGPIGRADRSALTEREALRTGLDLDWKGIRLGAAWNRVLIDSIADFGLPFDQSGALFPGGEIGGLELHGRVPLKVVPLWVEGWYTHWTRAEPWIYLPQTTFRTALAYHGTPLESGNLEISARLEFSHRSSMMVPTLVEPGAGPGGGGATTLVPPLSSFDFYLQIRVLDVRAFVRWNNITHRLDQYDLPGRIFPGQRAFYGIKWQFWN